LAFLRDMLHWQPDQHRGGVSHGPLVSWNHFSLQRHPSKQMTK
jgi:hypothetical protein